MQLDTSEAKISLTGSGEVHILLGSRKLPAVKIACRSFKGPDLGN
jgi:hypothetical protein